jgi:hypothetical protein
MDRQESGFHDDHLDASMSSISDILQHRRIMIDGVLQALDDVI